MKSPITWTDDKTIATLLLEYGNLSSELQLKAFNENFNNKEMLQSLMLTADHEAMIRTFASMIERNNQVLLMHLEKLGVLPKG